MVTYMPILYALQSGKIKPEDFVDYVPDESRYMYVRSGIYFGEEKLTTEFDLGWHAIIYKNFGVLLVSDKETKAQIKTTSGSLDFEELQKYASLYENNQFNSMSVVLTSELNQNIPEHLRKKDVYTHFKDAVPRFRRDSRSRRKQFKTYNHCFGYNAPMYYTKSMQPTIFIPPDTIVEIDEADKAGNSKEKAFKIFPRGSKEISVSKECLDEFKTPVWISLIEAMVARCIFPIDFLEYVSDKTNKFDVERIYSYDKSPENTEGWHPQLICQKKDCYVKLLSRSCERFSSDVYPDIKSGIVEFDEFTGDSPYSLLSVYAKLNLQKIRMIVTLSNNIMVQINHSEFDGSSLEKAYKLKVKEEK